MFQQREQREFSHSRLFIIGPKKAEKDEWREVFSQYGTIESLKTIQDRKTGDMKGFVYITYNKASEAAMAMEEMNNQPLNSTHTRPLKVVLANNREEGNVRDPDEDQKMMRIFIKIPKENKEEDVRAVFESYGDIEHITILTDKKTREPKGLAYVKYRRPYHAALALENCDPSYKAIFADTKTQAMALRQARTRDGYEDRYSDYGRSDRSVGYSNASRGDMDIGRAYRGTGEMCVEALVTSSCQYEQLRQLFDIPPGLIDFHYDQSRGICYGGYSNAQGASYARDKLDGLEYPLGNRIAVRLTSSIQRTGGYSSNAVQDMTVQLNSAMQTGDVHQNLVTLADSIKKATGLLEAAGLGGAVGSAGAMMMNATNGVKLDDEETVSYCSARLPPRNQPLASKDAIAEERLFIVAQTPFPDHYLTDVLSRFGNLIKSYFLPGKNFGYALYSDKDSAQKAVDRLHGEHICGIHVKVMIAEPRKKGESDGPPEKRTRY